MVRSQLFFFVGILAIATAAGKILSRVGYEDAPQMVLSSGLIAAGALAYLGVRADLKR